MTRLPRSGQSEPTGQPLGLDQAEGDVAVQLGVVGQVDLVLAALAEELPDLVAAAGEGGGLGFGLVGAGGPRRGLTSIRRSSVAGGWAALCGSKEFSSVRVIGVEAEHVMGAIPNRCPVTVLYRHLRLIEQAVDLPLDTFAGHDAAIVPHEAEPARKGV